MRLPAALFVVLLADAAWGQRPSTLSMTCAQAQSFLAARGAVVMSTGAHTFDRFVVSGRFCEPDEYLMSAKAPTRDTARCALGYTCEIGTPFWENDRFRRW